MSQSQPEPDQRTLRERVQGMRDPIALELPKRRPGTHWTGPSGQHVEVPVTNRTLVNLRRWGRTIT